MLTKTDLSQIKSILREIVREEVENESKALKHELQADITMSRIRIQSDIGELKDRVKNLEIGVKNLENKVVKMHKELKEEIKLVANFLDKEHMNTVKRVRKIEEHLGLTTA
ncbi:hypothetical protein HYT32_01630 [Candidatus Roizmanbacteria bacterium]|nr:hypothetical protein [Candidatus Roizmanbacteria bacterium]